MPSRLPQALTVLAGNQMGGAPSHVVHRELKWQVEKRAKQTKQLNDSCLKASAASLACDTEMHTWIDYWFQHL